MNEPNLEDIFTSIYRSNLWGSEESRSGLGSTKEFTNNICQKLISIIETFKIQNMIDTSCGDWNWMQSIQHMLPQYTGIDIVGDIVDTNTKKYANDHIKFIHDEFLKYITKLKDNSVDLIFCRHTLEHLPEEYNIEFLKQSMRVAKYLLVTNHETISNNTQLVYPNTYRPINIRLEPYSFIMPHFKYKIYDGPKKFLPEMFILLFDFNKNVIE